MIDIHCHILPGLDDGAETMDDALEMAELAAASGVSVICATPHTNLFEEMPNFESERIRALFEEFQMALDYERIPLQVVRGAEVFMTQDVFKYIQNGQIPSMNGTQCYLIEFGFEDHPEDMTEQIRMLADMGKIPVVAHPERYFCVQEDPILVRDWIELGALTQINKGSVLGRFGRECESCTDFLLDYGLVTCIASDAHSPFMRTTELREVSDYLVKTYGFDEWERLLVRNPEKLLRR